LLVLSNPSFLNHHIDLLIWALLTFSIWGNPSHLQYIESQLKEVQVTSSEKIHIHKTGSHSGYLTYDGIDVNGKRTSDEIWERTRALEEHGDKVTKLSVVGYSLGGLIARYAIGILQSQEYFEEIEPINFVAFCSPHVGVLNPVNDRLFIKAYNLVSPHFLGHTGQQLFLNDKIGNLDGQIFPKPILVWMADPKSVFFKGLQSFKHVSLYSNVVNDRRCGWFTAAVSDNDPYHTMTNTSPSNLQVLYLKGYELVIIDQEIQVKFVKTKKVHAPSLFSKSMKWIKALGNIVLYTPLWSVYFIISSIIQRIKVSKRVHAYFRDSKNSLGHLYEYDDDDTFLNNISRTLSNKVNDRHDSFIESVNTAINTVYDQYPEDGEPDSDLVLVLEKPVLNLSPDQQYIIKNLNLLPLKKYAILIHNSKLTHAAAIVRYSLPTFDEGKVVVRHFVNEVFKQE
jgi:hypothetical protein